MPKPHETLRVAKARWRDAQAFEQRYWSRGNRRNGLLKLGKRMALAALRRAGSRASSASEAHTAAMARTFGGSIPFLPESFDLVVYIDVLDHVQDMPRCLDEMRRVLRASG